MKIDKSVSAVVTGGASGLGFAVSKVLREHGAAVTLFDWDAEKGARAAEELGATFVETDVTDAKNVAAAFQAARAANGQENACINCAGIAPAAKTVGRDGVHDPTLFQAVINVNLIGSFNVSSQSAAGMADQKVEGVIINTASIAAYEGQMGQVAYAASKGGIVGLTLPMARDLARNKIRVMAIAPGIFGTPMVTAMPDEVQQSLAAGIPHPARLGDPTEYAKLALHIIENDYLNGSVIRLDGAARLAMR